MRFQTLSLAALILAAILLVLPGCGPGYRSVTTNGVEKLYKVDEQGTKSLIYEVSKDGTVTYHDREDPRARQRMEQEALAGSMRKAQEERLEIIAAAPKRQPGDPIYVLLQEPELGSSLKAAQHSEGAVAGELRKAFEGDRIIRLVGEKELRRQELAQMARALRGENPERAPAADVEVSIVADLKEVAGINRSTGKIGTMAALEYRATISSNWLRETHTVTESGNVLRNPEVTRALAAKVKKVIIEQIGPRIPADRSL